MLSIKLKLVQWLLDVLLGYQDSLETRRWLRQMRAHQVRVSGMSSHLLQDMGFNSDGRAQGKPSKTQTSDEKPRAAQINTRKSRRQMASNGRMQILNWPPSRRRTVSR
ncbi:MAG: hypothetical protein CENE_02062 [Candidatus Celerinatantimonas neptuna]|nr:MAG: hypothetical protein CENE_02062 [Candidatus Celerinatantimonas neptuna]